MEPPRRMTGPHRKLWMVAVAATAGLMAACGSSTASAQKVLGRTGALQVTDAFMPKPASPSVAAVYLTIRNTGAQADELVSVSTPVAASSMLMTEIERGSDGTMGTLPYLVIPAHGQAALAPGGDHAMLENPTVTFRVGQTVPVTLRFERAASLTIQVPVVPLTDILGGSSGGMASMPGM